MKTDQLEDVVRTEADLAEALLGLLKQQQNAIVHFQDAALVSLVEQQQEVLRPLEALEKERVKLATRSGDAIPVPQSASRLRNVVREIIHTNGQNRALLESSLRFVHENIRILTEDFSRQLVDHKV